MLLNSVLNSIFPPRCISCADVLPVNYLWQLCPPCDSSLERCDNSGANLNFSLYIYNDTIRQAIHNFKYNSRPKHGVFLGSLMAEYANEVLPRNIAIDMVIPIPLHKTKQRERGFNQAKILAHAICTPLNLNLNTSVLERTRNTSRQADLNITERAENLEGAFTVQDPLAVSGKNILLIDDILTTGSTIQACRAELLAFGANRVLSYSLAHAPLESTRDTQASRKNNIHDTLAR